MAAEHCEQLYATCAAYSVPIEAQVGAMQNLVGDISNRKVAPGAACISLKGTVKQIASALQYVAPCCHIAREVQTITRDGASHISVTYQGFDLRIIPVDLQVGMMQFVAAVCATASRLQVGVWHVGLAWLDMYVAC